MSVVRKLLACRRVISICPHFFGSKGGSGEGDGKPPTAKGEKPPAKDGSEKQKATGKKDDLGKGKSKGCSKLKASRICGSDAKKLMDAKKANSAMQGAKRPDKSPPGCGSQDAAVQKQPVRVTLIRGEGVGPELTRALQKVFCAAKVPVEWDDFCAHTVPDSNDVAPELLKSIEKNKVAIKGPIGNREFSKQLRKMLQLYAFVAICRKLQGINTPYGQLDCVIIRDQTEGEYSGIEHRVVPGVLQTIKVSTTAGADRLASYVFKYAAEKNRKKITVAHKANIMQLTDGNFLKSLRKASAKQSEPKKLIESYLDTACLNLLMTPEDSDIVVSSSMYGDVLTTIAASIIGGHGLCPCFNVSPHSILYDCMNFPGEDIAGKDCVNPTGMVLSGAIMLRDMNLTEYADKIECAVETVLKEGGCRTQDLGGQAKCSEFTQAICDLVEALSPAK